MVNNTKMSISPCLKYRSVAKTDRHGKHYQVGIVVRENGRFEVYSDFMLVSEFTDPQMKLQCIDVETDFNQFYLRFVSNSNEIRDKTELKKVQF